MLEKIIRSCVHNAQHTYRRLKSPRIQRVGWALAIIIFFGGFAVSVRAQSELIPDFRLGGAALVIFGLCPGMTFVNMATTRQTARLAGVQMGLSDALKLAVMSAAANHLPAPGGPMLRTAAFHSSGASVKHAGLANVASGFAWVSATSFFAGIWALSLDMLLSLILFGVGGGAFAVMLGVARALPNKFVGLISLMLCNFISAAVYALSISITLKAFGASFMFPQVVVVSAAGVIGAASSITPSGLGIREAAAAGLATLIGAEPAAAFAATAFVHLAMAAITGVFAVYFFMRSKAATLAT